jgi:hypothetical protein
LLQVASGGGVKYMTLLEAGQPFTKTVTLKSNAGYEGDTLTIKVLFYQLQLAPVVRNLKAKFYKFKILKGNHVYSVVFFEY